MRILILSQWFQPESFFKGLPFAKELVSRGHQVQVLTGFPNYPGGKVYSGYRIRLVMRETLEGIPIIRVALYPSHDRSAFRRILNYASFSLSAALLGPFLIANADVVYVYHPPPFIGLAAISIRLFRGIPFVYDIQDLWPDSLLATGMIRNRFVLGIVGIYCSVVYKAASAIVVLSPGFKRLLEERGVPHHKVSVIFNWSPDEENCQIPSDNTSSLAFKSSEKFSILFAGNMGAAQALDTILEAARMLHSECPAVRFVFIGEGIALASLKLKAQEQKLPNVVFLPRVSPSEARIQMQTADCLLVHLKNDPLFSITIPSKVQAYLAAGRPILIGVQGDAARLVEQAGAGIAFESENPSSLTMAIEKMMSLSEEERAAMGIAGRTFYCNHLSRAAAVSEFEKVFLNIAS